MSDKIVFDYAAMSASIKAIQAKAEAYATAADTLKSSLTNATANWTGASKNSFMTLIEGDFYKHTHTTIPEAVKGMASLLQNNLENMQNADSELAKSIPQQMTE